MTNRRIDLTNFRSGLLVAIRPTEERLHGNVLWECRCDCGNVVKFTATKIHLGKVTHCGCRKNAGVSAMNAPVQNDSGISRFAISGYEGVYKRGTKWIATITRNKMQYPLGIYETPEQAYHVRCDAVLHSGIDFWGWYSDLMKNYEQLETEE